MFRLDPELVVTLTARSFDAEARLIATDGRALRILLGPHASPLPPLLRATVEAFGAKWAWGRLTPSPQGEGVVDLVTDDAYDEAAIWAFFFDARRVRSLGASLPIDAVSAEIPFRGHFTREKAERRMAWLRGRTGHDLAHLTAPRLDAALLQGNVEQLVGSIEIPVGLVGPLLFHGELVRGHVVAPFATTEGALVASASRGAKALTLGGGVTTHVVHQRMTRAPVFVMHDVDGAMRLAAWLLDHEREVRSKAELASRHAKLLRLEPVQIGRYLHVRFIYETGDAAGQNMTTICTWRACAWIQAQLPFLAGLRVEHFFIEGNTSGDKKVSHLSAQGGRGTRVTADAFLSRSVLKRVLNVKPEVLLEALEAGATGSSYSGMMGVNVNVANAIAALFTATGQDIASVHESSVAQFHLKSEGDGVRATLLLHSLVIGTVGGGTWLPTQADALRVLGCGGAGRSRRFAEIIAGFALGLELSTLSAVAAGDFVAAHEVMGRPRNDAGLRDADLTPQFFAERLTASRALGEGPVVVDELVALDAPDGDSVLGQLIAGRTRKKLGVFPYALVVRVDGKEQRFTLALKSKPRDTEVVQAMTNMSRMCGEPLATLYETHGFDLGFRSSHIRELAVAELRDPRYLAIAPRTYFTYARDATDADPRAIYLLGSEYLDDVTHMGTVDELGAWSREDVETALDGIASFHAIHLGDTEALARAPWMDAMTPVRMQRLAPLWASMVEYNRAEYPDIYTKARADQLLAWVSDVRTHWEALQTSPLTLVHNDFNTRNIALRRPSAEHPAPRLCAFDWELATVHAPQRDACELLSFVLSAAEPLETRTAMLEYFRGRLEHHSGVSYPRALFHDVCRVASIDFALTRLGPYTVAHGFRAFDWLRRVLESHFAYLDDVR